MSNYTSRLSDYNKYGNKSTVYNGRRYMSKYEARVAQELDLELRAGVYTAVEPQYRIKLYTYLPDGSKIYLFDYLCDFRCTLPDGSYKLVEAKGAITDTYRIKRALLTAVWLPDHPDYSFEEVKDNPRRYISKRRS